MQADYYAQVAQREEYEMTTPKVYTAINQIQQALAKTGIAKDRKNTQGSGYMFRGIDDVYNALSPLMAQHGLCIIPRMIARSCEERTSKSGGSLFYVTVEAEFDFVAAEDGSKHTARTFGEAMDSGDKATNKAMSAAYKYAAFQAFAIPTESNEDADAQTHEVRPLISEARRAELEAKFDQCVDLPGLSAIWQAMTAQERRAMASAKDGAKSRIAGVPA